VKTSSRAGPTRGALRAGVGIRILDRAANSTAQSRGPHRLPRRPPGEADRGRPGPQPCPGPGLDHRTGAPL